jgi:uncharacterized membrane protein
MTWAALRGPALIVLLGASLLADSATAQGAAAPAANEISDWLDLVLHWIARVMEIAGIAVIVIGAVAATFTYLRQRGSIGGADEPYDQYRSSLGRSILLGLEFLVAADIIGTVAIEPTLNNLAVLAGIVLIRTILSFSLEVEIEGRWPWQKGRHNAGARPPPGDQAVSDPGM